MDLLLLSLLSLLPCRGSAMTVMEALTSRFDLITFTNFIRNTNVSQVLDSGNHMVIAPTDSAFNLLPSGYMAMLHDTQNPYYKNLLPDMVKYHIIPYTGQLNTSWTGDAINTLLDKPVRIITYESNNLTAVNGGLMRDSNLNTSNGHIYLVDRIVNPPQADIYTSLMEDDQFSTFLSVVTLAGMVQKLKEDKITVFAPTNAAFQYLGQDVTTRLFNSQRDLEAFTHFYVVPGLYYTDALPSGQMVNTTGYDCFRTHLHFSGRRLYPGVVPISQADWLATNGVIQVLERIKMPKMRCYDWS